MFFARCTPAKSTQGQQESCMTLSFQHSDTASQDGYSARLDDAFVSGDVLVSRLGHILRTRTDLEQMLDLFFFEAQRMLSFDGIRYSNFHRHSHFEVGVLSGYHAHYRLFANQDYLGEMDIARSSPFGEEELETLERLISALISPLRNTMSLEDDIRQ